MTTPERKTVEQIEQDSRKMAFATYPHQNPYLEGSAYAGEERYRVPLREAFDAGWTAAITALRAAGLLMNTPTEEQIERAAQAILEELASKYPSGARGISWAEMRERGSDVPDQYVRATRAALAAVGVAPQEHEHTWDPECTPPRRTCGCDKQPAPQDPSEERCWCFDLPEREHHFDCGAAPAPSPDREKLIAELRYRAHLEGRGAQQRRLGIAKLLRKAATALAAPVEVDESKLAEVICRNAHATRWQYRAIRNACEDCWRSAGAVVEYLRGGGR